MGKNASSETPPNEVEISLEDEAALELESIEVDSDELPIEFSIDGAIRAVKSGVLDDLVGKDVEPIAVRFRLLTDDE